MLQLGVSAGLPPVLALQLYSDLTSFWGSQRTQQGTGPALLCSLCERVFFVSRAF